MKPRMVEFVVEYKKEIDGYVNGGSIFTTQATGKEIERNLLDASFTRKIVPCLSGPLGGDIQVATTILLDLCDAVIFFIDPLNPHPHLDDIRVVLMAGMTNPNVRVLTNETAARAWAEALRKRDSSTIQLYEGRISVER
jgi:methylglyoxal synthase